MTEGAMIGSVTWKNVPTGEAPEVHRRLFDRLVEVEEPRLDHDGRIAHRECHVRDRHRPEAAVEADGDEEEQQRKPRDHLRHDERREDHAREQRAAAKAAHAHEHDRRQRAEDGSDRGREDRHAYRHPRGIHQALVVEQPVVPSCRPAAPHRDQLRVVEAVDHQQQDRDVEERKAEPDRRSIEPGETGLHTPASRCFC